jgi:hypothetical protein
VRGRWVFVALAVLLPCGAAAQVPVWELWPELDVFYSPAKHQRTMLELSSQTEHEGTKHHATAGLFQDYLFLPAGFVRGGYRFTFSTRDASYRESRFVGEANITAWSSPTWRLINRLRGELRDVNREWSYRIRERLHFQHLSQATGGPRLEPYVTAEVYYDSRFNTLDRIAGRAGVETHLGRVQVLDVYYARQENSRSTPGAVNAFGITLKLNY